MCSFKSICFGIYFGKPKSKEKKPFELTDMPY